MAPQAGRSAVLAQFLADGMNHMFGNPGTVEQGFLDALREHPDLKYVLALQESVAVLMADGYARATQRPTLVQLHSTPGVGNAIGALYQAKRGHSPLVVIGGDAGIRYAGMDAQMAGDLVAFTEPVTKWSTVVVDPSSLLRVIRRAIKIAATPPMGPVYVCLPAGHHGRRRGGARAADLAAVHARAAAAVGDPRGGADARLGHDADDLRR